jgi:murein L,D-transpeptidase YcbB/YkuD
MGRGRLLAVSALGALALALPAHAQDQDVAPVPTETTPAARAEPTPEPTAPEAAAAPAPPPVLPAAPASAPLVLSDSAVDSFYAARAGAPVWFRDAETRDAAGKLAALLRHSDLDGVADSAELAAAVGAAVARGLPNDDKTISIAWVRYVRALKAPVQGISYGDPKLAIQSPSADAILASAAGAASLSAHVAQVSAVNSFYSALHESAVKQGATSDPHVRATLDRLRLLPASGRAILVDVANAELMMLEDGRVIDSMKVIVGKRDAPTPLLAGTIHYVTFNPYWHIPQDVARRKVAPIILKRGVSYLKSARYEAVAGFGGDKELPIDPESIDWKAVADGTIEVHVRQRTGPNNMMGAMKFGFVNDYGVFLHDTPHKDLFAKAKRNLSLGCVRVEHPARLAQWLLGRDPVPPSDGAEQLVQVDKGVPIYILYLTARPNGDQLAFADDVYGLDQPAEPLAPVATTSVSAKR